MVTDDYPALGSGATPSERIRFALDIFDRGAAAYKKAQNLLQKIDSKVHNEYQYSARANATLLRWQIDPTSISPTDVELAINNATEAACHILNDVLDLIFYHAKKEGSKLSGLCKYTLIGDVYPEWPQVRSIINRFSETIAQSRGGRGIGRVRAYIDMVESEDFKTLIRFCESTQAIEDDLKVKRRLENDTARKDARLLFWPLIVIVLLALAAPYISRHL